MFHNDRIHEKSRAGFYDALSTQKSDLERMKVNPQVNLEPSPEVRETISQLKELLVSFDMSLISGVEGGDVDRILDSFVGPLIGVCDEVEVGVVERLIYTINCVYLVKVFIS